LKIQSPRVLSGKFSSVSDSATMNSSVIFWCLLALAAGRREGSGDLAASDDIDDVEMEGSGDDFEELKLVPDKTKSEEEKESVYDIHFDKFSEYYEDEESDYEDLIKNYNTEDGYEYTEVNADIERDSVLKIAKDSFADIEIKPKPPSTEEDFILETSQILIMVGSAFVSFGIVMLAFFMCRKTMEKKKQKSMPFILPDPRVGREPTPIVKDYQRVPTDTKEYLQCREDTHIEMYRGEAGSGPHCEGGKSGHAACDPLIK